MSDSFEDPERSTSVHHHSLLTESACQNPNGSYARKTTVFDDIIMLECLLVSLLGVISLNHKQCDAASIRRLLHHFLVLAINDDCLKDRAIAPTISISRFSKL